MCQVKKRQRSVTERPVGVGLDPPDSVAVVDRDMPGDHLGGQRQDGIILAVEDLDEDHAEREKLSGDEILARLERLAKLREQGILSDEEFQAAKKKILG